MSNRATYKTIAQRIGIKSPGVTYDGNMKRCSIWISQSDRARRNPEKNKVGEYQSPDHCQLELKEDLRILLQKHPEHHTQVKEFVIVELIEKGHESITDDSAQEWLATHLIHIADSPQEQFIIQPFDSLYARHLLRSGDWHVRLYETDIVCPYCGESVTIERHSPKKPKHCEKNACQLEHKRTLGKARSRRYRANRKSGATE